jgi:hypothetical protein
MLQFSDLGRISFAGFQALHPEVRNPENILGKFIKMKAVKFEFF